MESKVIGYIKATATTQPMCSIMLEIIKEKFNLPDLKMSDVVFKYIDDTWQISYK